MRKTGASRVEEGEESELLPFTHTALPGPLQVRLDTKDTHTPPIRKLIPTSASSTPYCGHLKCCGCPTEIPESPNNIHSTQQTTYGAHQ